MAKNAATSFAASSVLLWVDKVYEFNERRGRTKCTYNIFAVVSIREADADRLVKEDHVRVVVPRMWVERGTVSALN